MSINPVRPSLLRTIVQILMILRQSSSRVTKWEWRIIRTYVATIILGKFTLEHIVTSYVYTGSLAWPDHFFSFCILVPTQMQKEKKAVWPCKINTQVDDSHSVHYEMQHQLNLQQFTHGRRDR